MKEIKIISGTFGWSHGTYDLVRAGDPPITVDDELAERLVEQGVAEYTAAPSPGTEEPFTPDTEDETEDEPTEDGVDIEGMSAKELRELAKQYGLAFSANVSKPEIIEAIYAAMSQAAPAFDATEAVQ